jgi:transcriptional regulator with XRE-family HTH domain
MTDPITRLVAEARLRRALPPPAVCRAIRESAGISQLEVARVLGVDRVSVTRYESGVRLPRPAVRERYVELLSRLADQDGERAAA